MVIVPPIEDGRAYVDHVGCASVRPTARISFPKQIFNTTRQIMNIKLCQT